MISKSFLFEIKQALDTNKNFSSNDFIVTAEYAKLKISYAYDKKYFFTIDIPKETSKLSKTETHSRMIGFNSTHKEIEYEEYRFGGSVSPGDVANEERFDCEGKHKVLKKLDNWLKNLWNELTIQPELRKLADLEAEIQNINEKFDSLSEDFFTREEASNLSAKLDRLEQQFREKLEAEIQDKERLKNTLAELHGEIEKLKGQSKVLNKKNWFKSFGGKVFKWVSKEENRKFLKDTGDFIRPLLPDSINNIL